MADIKQQFKTIIQIPQRWSRKDEKMKKMKRFIKNEKGSSIFEWVVVIAVVAIIAVLVAPKVQGGIEARADTTILRITDLETIMKK